MLQYVPEPFNVIGIARNACHDKTKSWYRRRACTRAVERGDFAHTAYFGIRDFY
jgi:hypothetical protein